MRTKFKSHVKAIRHSGLPAVPAALEMETVYLWLKLGTQISQTLVSVLNETMLQ